MSLSLEYRPIDQLPPDERNPKGHALDDIEKSMDRFGYVEPVLLDERTGKLLAGHGRREVLERKRARGDAPPVGIEIDEQGAWCAPVVLGVRTANDIEARALIIGVNNLVTAGGWEPSKLGPLLEEIRAESTLDGLGYEGVDVDEFLAGLRVADEPAPAEAPALPADIDEPLAEKPPQLAKPGDLFMLGEHRLMVGDCRNARHVARLLDGAKVNVAVTSPPYAEMRKYDDETEFRPIPPDEYVAWFAPVAENVAKHLADDGSWFVNIKASVEELDTYLYVFDLVLAHVREWGWHFATEFCWERVGMPQKVDRRFKNQFEPVYQFARGDWKIRPDAVRHASASVPIPLGPGNGSKSWAPTGAISDDRVQGTPGFEWFRDRKAPGLAYPGNRLPTFSGSHEATGHGAAYPVGLPAWFARAFSDERDTIYDPFTGSGSSILAAHQTNRVGFGMELSPLYVDIACARWQRHTGIMPLRDGEPVDYLPAPAE